MSLDMCEALVKRPALSAASQELDPVCNPDRLQIQTQRFVIARSTVYTWRSRGYSSGLQGLSMVSLETLIPSPQC